MTPIKTSVSTAIFESAALGTEKKFELETIIPTLKTLGYEGIEILPYDASKVKVSNVKDALGGDMEVSAIASGAISFRHKLSFLDPDKNKRLRSIYLMKDYIKLACDLGTRNVLIGSAVGKIKPGISREKAITWLVECLKKSGSYAYGLGVSLAIEPVNRYETNCLNTVQDGLDTIELTGLDNIHLLIDIFHMNIEEASIEGSIRRAGKQIAHVHIADSNRWPPGYGHLDFKSVLNSLEEVGYEGYLSIECLPKPNLKTALEKGINYLKSL